MGARSLHLADLAGRGARRPAWRTGRSFAAAAVLVVVAFAGVAAFMDRFTIWQAESFGDRRLGRPAADECEIVRSLLRDHRDHDRALLLRSLGASDRKLQLRAFAWRSTGERIPGQGVDWRKCHGLGAYARRLGMARLGSGETGPRLYISRAAMSGSEASVFEALIPPEGTDPRQVPVRAWEVMLRRGRGDGGWMVLRRRPVAGGAA